MGDLSDFRSCSPLHFLSIIQPLLHILQPKPNIQHHKHLILLVVDLYTLVGINICRLYMSLGISLPYYSFACQVCMHVCVCAYCCVCGVFVWDWGAEAKEKPVLARLSGWMENIRISRDCSGICRRIWLALAAPLYNTLEHSEHWL